MRLRALPVVVLLAITQAPMSADHVFTLSSNVYRLPYITGTLVLVTKDHHTHGPNKDRIDMVGPDGATVVAAADGIIRGIVDSNGLLSAEHSCQDDDDVAGLCTDYNNYVWIQHLNGEWTKYSHLAFGSVTALGHSVGDAVLAGTMLGIQSDVGFASGEHLHFEVGIPNDPTDDTPFSTLGGFIQGVNVVPVICNVPNNLLEDGQPYIAVPCFNNKPTANAGGPYQVDEGSAISLDGTGSSDPDGDAITYLWSPGTRLDDPASPTPVYSAVDDTVDVLILKVTDGGDVTPASALSDNDSATVLVANVAPTVALQGAAIMEGATAAVSATFTDPGTLDTHTAFISWGDGTPAEPVEVTSHRGRGSITASHVYGDDGTYSIFVVVTDDDGGAGAGNAAVSVRNVDPSGSLSPSGAVTFPGGGYLVINAGGELSVEAEGSDPGSDDLTFTWSTGGAATSFNDGLAPDPPSSPHGMFPFNASDLNQVVYAVPGVQQLVVVISDDDSGSTADGAKVIVTGNADRTEASGWWKQQYSGKGKLRIQSTTAAGYLAIVNAVSGVFSEALEVETTSDVHAVLSPPARDQRARATAQLMLSWLHFASGAVAWNAQVPVAKRELAAFLDLMGSAEATILNSAATSAELLAVERALQQVRRAY